MNSRIQGFLLAKEKSGERDANLIFFSKEKGKIKIFVRGAQKSISKLAAYCQFFVYESLWLARGKSSSHLIGGEEVASCKSIHQSWEKLKSALFVLKNIEKREPFLRPNEKIFALAIKTFVSIDNSQELAAEKIAYAFLIKFLALSGLKPVLTKCLVCRKKILDQKFWFDFKDGGVICASCGQKNDHNIVVGSSEIKFIDQILYAGLEEIDCFQITAKDFLGVKKILDKFSEWHL